MREAVTRNQISEEWEHGNKSSKGGRHIDKHLPSTHTRRMYARYCRTGTTSCRKNEPVVRSKQRAANYITTGTTTNAMRGKGNSDPILVDSKLNDLRRNFEGRLW